MNFAIRMQGVADKLLSKFDERTGDARLAILKQGESVWNPTLGEMEIGTDTKYFLTGAQINSLDGLVNGTTIQQGDMMLTVSTSVVDASNNPVDYAPQTNDKMLIDGVRWSIVNTPHSNYTGSSLTVAYKIQVRK